MLQHKVTGYCFPLAVSASDAKVQVKNTEEPMPHTETREEQAPSSVDEEEEQAGEEWNENDGWEDDGDWGDMEVNSQSP